MLSSGRLFRISWTLASPAWNKIGLLAPGVRSKQVATRLLAALPTAPARAGNNNAFPSLNLPATPPRARVPSWPPYLASHPILVPQSPPPSSLAPTSPTPSPTRTHPVCASPPPRRASLGQITPATCAWSLPLAAGPWSRPGVQFLYALARSQAPASSLSPPRTQSKVQPDRAPARPGSQTSSPLSSLAMSELATSGLRPPSAWSTGSGGVPGRDHPRAARALAPRGGTGPRRRLRSSTAG